METPDKIRQIKLIKFLFDRFAPTGTPTDVQLTYAIKDFNRDHPIPKDYETSKQWPITEETRGGFNGKIIK